jgi:hypothetical protein
MNLLIINDVNVVNLRSCNLYKKTSYDKFSNIAISDFLFVIMNINIRVSNLFQLHNLSNKARIKNY